MLVGLGMCRQENKGREVLQDGGLEHVTIRPAD